ncbi:trehalose-phosphatase [Pseudoroseomonas cervicalis]|uniref:trehalose-phosphatase n=1 Tax=Teichococcus cervicalis TaxID=204525 RepID=UPI0035EA097B
MKQERRRPPWRKLRKKRVYSASGAPLSCYHVHAAAPPPHAALFLDLDGTLIEIAPARTPWWCRCICPACSPGCPTGWAGRWPSSPAVGWRWRALTSAPPIAYAAERHPSTPLPAPPSRPCRRCPPCPRPRRDCATAFADAEGLLFEPKQYGFVLHFRANPEKGPAATAFLEGLVAGSDFQVMPAHAAAELRPKGLDKGSAVRWLMRHAPFAGRQPVFIGDDVTDQFGIDACAELGGTGYRIPMDFPGPAAVHDWLERIAGRMAA